MSDFMKWLYIHYIQPELAASPVGEYEMCLSLARNSIPPHAKPDFQKAAEYIAIQAFLLGLRTGKGLSDNFTA